MKFYIVDAFTEQSLGGNSAAVVLLPDDCDYPPDDKLLKVALKLKHPETAFVKCKDNDIFQLRFFTPKEEIDLCGNAALASFSVLREENRLCNGGGYTAKTQAGDLHVDLEGDIIMIDVAPPEYIDTIENKADLIEIYEAVGLKKSDGKVSLEGEWDLFPEIISTGLIDVILPVEDWETLKKIRPNFDMVREVSEKYGVNGIHTFALGEGLIGSVCCEGSCDFTQVTAHCRYFSPALTGDEKAATGTASGSLTYYLYKNALLDGGSCCRFSQGEFINRSSTILSTINSDEPNIKIRIGGSARVLAKGRVDTLGLFT
jgi:PhzF family phenazine biosynthesis protein